MGRSRSWSRSRSRSPDRGHRVHIADLCSSASKRDLEKECEKYGPISEVWMAKGPPCFAFAVFKYREDAEDCVRDMNGKTIRDKSIRVTHALPRTQGRGRRRFDPDMRCYNCGQRGHFSRDCNGSWSGGGRRRSPSPRYRDRRRNSRSRSGSRSRSYRRSPSRSASRSPPPQRASRASPPPQRVSRSRSRS